MAPWPRPTSSSPSARRWSRPSPCAAPTASPFTRRRRRRGRAGAVRLLARLPRALPRRLRGVTPPLRPLPPGPLQNGRRGLPGRVRPLRFCDLPLRRRLARLRAAPRPTPTSSASRRPRPPGRPTCEPPSARNTRTLSFFTSPRPPEWRCCPDTRWRRCFTRRRPEGWFHGLAVRPHGTASAGAAARRQRSPPRAGGPGAEADVVNAY